MGILDLFRRKPTTETRASGSGFTTQIIGARASYISGVSGIAELTGTVQSCVSLWEGGLGLADVEGTDLLDRRALALAARSLALRGEALFLIDDRLVPCSDWDLSTRNGEPTAYRVSVPEAGDGRTQTALAGEVLHFRTGCDPATPYLGTAPLRRAMLTAGMLHAVETALSEVFEIAPLGSQIVPFPETPDVDLDALARGFRGKRGAVALRESVNVTAAGGPGPQSDWQPRDLSPDLSRSMATQTLDAARQSIGMVYGVLPGLLSPTTTGPMVREAQRHLAQWCLQPIATGMAEEASAKLATTVTLDTMRPLQAYDAGGRARAVTAMIGALAQAKEANVDPALALKFAGIEDG